MFKIVTIGPPVSKGRRNTATYRYIFPNQCCQSQSPSLSLSPSLTLPISIIRCTLSLFNNVRPRTVLMMGERRTHTRQNLFFSLSRLKKKKKNLNYSRRFEKIRILKVFFLYVFRNVFFSLSEYRRIYLTTYL